MSTQPLLFDAQLKHRKTARDKFMDFHRQNPQIYDFLLYYARQARERGHKKYSMRTIWELMRWDAEVKVKENSDDSFKLNNNYPPFYSRLLEERNPDLKGFFEQRKQSAR